MNRKSFLRWFLLIVVLAAIYYFNPDIFKQILRIKNISVNNIIILSCLCITNQVLLGIEIKILCKAFDVHLSIVECFGLSSVRSIANYLPLGAGIISNALYLKKQKQLSVANYSSSLSVSIILMFLVAGFIGLLTAIFLKITSNLHMRLKYICTSFNSWCSSEESSPLKCFSFVHSPLEISFKEIFGFL